MISEYFQKGNLLKIALIAGAIYSVWSYWTSPPNTFNPLCTYDLIYKLEVTITYKDRDFSGGAVFQNSRSRDWISGLNRAECPSIDGTAIAFRLEGEKTILIPTRICPDAIDHMSKLYSKKEEWPYPVKRNYALAMAKGAEVDLLQYCRGIEHNSKLRFASEEAEKANPEAYMVDSAVAPKYWEPIHFGQMSKILGGQVNLKYAKATASKTMPYDNLSANAPGLLQAGFEDGGSWWWSPERIIAFERRHKNGFTYHAKKLSSGG